MGTTLLIFLRAHWRRVIVITLVIVSFYMGGQLLHSIADSVQERRSNALERDRKLCDVAVNLSNQKWRKILADLSAEAAPPDSPEQARQRVIAKEIFAREFADVDCVHFALTGELVPISTVP